MKAVRRLHYFHCFPPPLFSKLPCKQIIIITVFHCETFIAHVTLPTFYTFERLSIAASAAGHWKAADRAPFKVTLFLMAIWSPPRSNVSILLRKFIFYPVLNCIRGGFSFRWVGWILRILAGSLSLPSPTYQSGMIHISVPLALLRLPDASNSERTFLYFTEV